MPFHVSNGTGDKLRIEYRASDGSLVGRVEAKFTDESKFVKAAKALGVEKDEIVRLVDEYERNGHSEEQKPKFVIKVRDRVGTDTKIVEHDEPLNCLLAACRQRWEFEDPIASWDDYSKMACVDLDSDTWTEQKLERLLSRFQPTPALSWVTKSGGLRFVFGSNGRLNAEEVASVAYLHLSTIELYQSLEVKTDTRLPVSEVFVREQGTDYGALRRWLRQYSHDDEATAAWLADHGMAVGGKYEHDKCPVDPTSTAKGKPVLVSEHGVYCFVCEAHGITHGSQKPGFFPFSTFVGGSSATLLYNCLEGMCHWEHAQHLMEEKFGLKNRPAKVAYGAALKLHHKGMTDEACKRVLDAGHNLLRMDGAWTNSNGDPYSKDVKAVLAALPAAGVLVGDRFRPVAEKIAVLEQSFDLAQYGYPHLTPIFGLKMYPSQDDSNKISVVVQIPALARESMEVYRPKYTKRRVDGWPLIEQSCPGISKNYVKLLLVAKGYAEAAIGMPPMVFVSGPTSSAKTGTVTVAATIAGDVATEHLWTSNIERVRQAVRDSKTSGTFCVFNEFFKEAERAKQTAVQAADFILNLTPASMSWKIWTGPVRLGDLPVFVWTDTKVPLELKQDAQLARRLIHVHLPTQVDWRESLGKSGVDQLNRIRIHSLAHAEACNSIVSEVIDEFFAAPTTFQKAAASLGFFCMSESQEAADSVEVLRELFKATCSAPELSGSDAMRWSGRGWKLINRSMETPLQQLWEQVCDESWKDSRRCSEVDWAKVIGAKETVRFETKSHGSSRLVLRFRADDGSRQGYKVNQELLS